MTTFVLASASPARLGVLRAAGVDPIVRVSGVDEDALTASLGESASPEDVVVALARAKAEAVVNSLSGEGTDAPSIDAVVVGCDSMLSIGGELQGKPHTVDIARRRWQAMAGTSGELLTGHSVVRVHHGKATAVVGACHSTTVHFATPSEADLEAYLASGEPLEVAGSFTLDGLGGWFVDRIEGDPSSVIGIGLPLVRRLLNEVGVTMSDVWSARQ
ncbi:septum formation inhibitor Maf [Rhodococcus sp. 15-649-1-2]|uniref:Maf family protein n=1 Tax=Rhodococcoides fascians TaxID=1828 RepID=UPI00055C99A6|nr:MULTISPECIES: Maf family protein [Rhodococcus]OZE88175.1 septum formation inhibitor Maf [Rhodococcus sp. 15-649-1-2]